MNKTIKTLAWLGSGLVLLSFSVVVINQTAQVVQLAKEVHPGLGTVTLWGLLISYGGLVGVPVEPYANRISSLSTCLRVTSTVFGGL